MTYLSFWPFDYGYNVAAGVIVGTLGNLNWVVWCFRTGFNGGREYKSILLKAIAYLTLAMSLELFDGPPLYYVLDAHSLWHLATVPIVPMFYEFIVKDSKFEFHKSNKGY